MTSLRNWDAIKLLENIITDDNNLLKYGIYEGILKNSPFCRTDYHNVLFLYKRTLYFSTTRQDRIH